MTKRRLRARSGADWSFSLVEVVLALGVIAIAIVAILGVIPVGLSTGHSAQDETRAAQIAQSLLGSLSAQTLKRDPAGQPVLDANGHFQLNDAVKIPGVVNPIDLTTSVAVQLYSTNDGQITDSVTNATYAVLVALNTSPTGFDPPAGTEVFANQVTITVAWPATALVANHTKRDFIKIVSKY